MVYGLGLEYKANDSIRLELNWNQFNKFKVKGSYQDGADYMNYKQNITSNFFAINAFYDINLKHDFLAFLTTGVGMAVNRSGSLKKYNNGKLNVFREFY